MVYRSLKRQTHDLVHNCRNSLVVIAARSTRPSVQWLAYVCLPQPAPEERRPSRQPALRW